MAPLRLNFSKLLDPEERWIPAPGSYEDLKSDEQMMEKEQWLDRYMPDSSGDHWSGFIRNETGFPPRRKQEIAYQQNLLNILNTILKTQPNRGIIAQEILKGIRSY